MNEWLTRWVCNFLKVISWKQIIATCICLGLRYSTVDWAAFGRWRKKMLQRESFETWLVYQIRSLTVTTFRSEAVILSLCPGKPIKPLSCKTMGQLVKVISLSCTEPILNVHFYRVEAKDSTVLQASTYAHCYHLFLCLVL